MGSLAGWCAPSPMTRACLARTSAALWARPCCCCKSLFLGDPHGWALWCLPQCGASWGGAVATSLADLTWTAVAPAGLPLRPDEVPSQMGSESTPRLQATHASKMDAISQEYTLLLTSQLDSQRMYFEEQLARSAEQSEAELAQLRADLATSTSQCSVQRCRCEPQLCLYCRGRAGRIPLSCAELTGRRQGWALRKSRFLSSAAPFSGLRKKRAC